MNKKKLIMVIATLCLLASLIITTGGTGIQVSAAAVKYPVYANAGPGGKISPAGIILAGAGSSLTFTVTPGNGFHVADFLVDGVSKKAELLQNKMKYKLTTITSAHRVLALFSSSLVINAGAGEGGSISPAGPVKVDWNKNVTFTITPSTGCYVLNLIVDGARIPPASTYTFKNVKAAHSIVALFADMYPVLATAGPNGSVDPDGVDGYKAGSSQLFTFTPEDNYHVMDVRVNENWIGAMSSFNLTNVDKPYNILVVFDNHYTVISIANAGGSISPLGASTVVAGTSPVFTVTPKTGYYIEKILLDGAEVAGVPHATTAYDYAIPADQMNKPHTVMAFFTKGTPPT